MAIPTPLQAGALVGGLHRSPTATDEQRADARRDLRAARVKRAIEKAVAEAPPLTPQQCAELQTLLWSGGVQTQ